MSRRPLGKSVGGLDAHDTLSRDLGLPEEIGVAVIQPLVNTWRVDCDRNYGAVSSALCQLPERPIARVDPARAGQEMVALFQPKSGDTRPRAGGFPLLFSPRHQHEAKAMRLLAQWWGKLVRWFRTRKGVRRG